MNLCFEKIHRLPKKHNSIHTSIILVPNIIIYLTLIESLLHDLIPRILIIGLSNIRIGKKVEVTLETKDKMNASLDRGGEPVTAEITCRDLTGTTKTTEIPVNDLRNGKYSFSFVPEALGKLLLHVYVRGQQIKVVLNIHKS